MKPTLIFLLSAATSAFAATPSPALDLESDVSNGRFKVNLTFESPILQINPTFLTVMFFMNVLARTDYNEDFPPGTYKAPLYRQVQLTTMASTKTRYLLWGIYIAITEMVEIARFNNVLIKLIYENGLVGEIYLTANEDLTLPSATGGTTQNRTDDDGELTLIGVGNEATQVLSKGKDIPPVRNMNDSDSINSKTSFNGPSSASIQLPPYAPLSSTLSIRFTPLDRSTKLKRNNVFLTFYAALLHVAQFSVTDDMSTFNADSSKADVRVFMWDDTGTGCKVMPFTFLPFT